MAGSKIQLTYETKVKDVCEHYLLSTHDLENLIEASHRYIKFQSESKRETWSLCVNAYFKLGNNKIKVSTYHDIKEVKWHMAEKTDVHMRRKFLVMGTKMKEECWDKEKKEYTLRYWMIFEIQPPGKYKLKANIVPPKGWDNPFISCAHGFEYQRIEDDPRKNKDYHNFIVRKRGSSMLQVNYHLPQSQHQTEGQEIKLPETPETIPGEEYVSAALLRDYEQKMIVLAEEVRGIDNCSYAEFMKKLGEIYEHIKLHRLDSYVI